MSKSQELDELAAVIEQAYILNEGMVTFELLAHAALAAGYRKPRVITTADELDALPAGALIMDQDPDVCRKREDGLWVSITDPEYAFGSRIMKDSLPVTVLHEGTPNA